MGGEGAAERLSDISTIWSALREAHEGSPSAVTTAQQLLLERYRGAVFRYLRRAVDDPAAAEDLTQEFALALVRGEFRHADPERGRFRNYVKSVLFHLVSRYRKAQAKVPRPLAADSPHWESLAAPVEDADAQFNETWREELLARTWKALGDVQPTFATFLRFRAEHAEMRSPALAEALGRKLGKPLTADTVRQTLRRARAAFTGLLLAEVAHSLDAPTPADLEQELQELNLLEYCKDALKRYR